MTTDPIEILYARLDERLKTIEREMGSIRASQLANAAPPARPSWPTITAALAAVAALIITLATKL